MHPAEQITAFGTLAAQGKTPAQIGDVLGYGSRHVQRMLKLSNLAPSLIEKLAQDGLMIPRHLSLVTQLPEREAAINAILHVEENLRAVNRRQPYPYARAFFRFLTGSSKISSQSLNRVRGVYWLKEDKIPLASYEEAIDRLIRSRGKYCWFPLDGTLAHTLFPEQAFSVSERQNKRNKREAVQYGRQEERRAQEREDKYRNLVGKAEIDLAFQTPETLRAWYEFWSQQDTHLVYRKKRA